MKQLFIYSILCLSLAACGGKKNNAAEPQEKPAADSIVEEKIVALPPLEEGEVFLKDKDPFGEVVELQGNHIVEPDTFIFKPASPNLVIKDSLMIMQSRNAPFYIFRYPEFTYIKTVGRTGNGPDEFVAPYVIASLNPAYLCYLFERPKGMLYGLDKKLEIHPIQKIHSSKSMWDYIEHIYAAGKNSFVYPKGRNIYRATLEGDSVRTEEIKDMTLKQAKKMPATGCLGINPARHRMVYAYKYARIIKFMDLDSNAERTLNFQQSGFDEGTLHIADGLDANVTYYMQVLPTRDYVYITYSGRTPYVVAAENNKGKHHMYVEKYDWNGNPVKKYKLNDFCVYTVLDEKTNRLVLSTYYYDDPLVVYQLD